VIIKVERSGGFTGLPILKEIDAKDLPPNLFNVAKKIMLDQKLYALPMTKTPKGSADYYSYKISIQDADNRKIIECNEFNIQDNLKLLVRYIERNSSIIK
jgi:hypothetical protein